MTTYEFAAAYVSDHYENQLGDRDGLAVEDLSPARTAELLVLVADGTARLYGMIVLACEAWAADADVFDPTEEPDA